MARHDYRCPRCGYIREVDVSILVGASNHVEWCGCDDVRMEPVPAIRLSLFSDADSKSSPHDFTKFTTQVETPGGGYRDVTVSSLRDIRRLERESEQAERDGFGRRMVWRDYSQDHSNQFVHTLGADPSLRPPKRFSNGQPVLVRKGEPVTADHGTLEES